MKPGDLCVRQKNYAVFVFDKLGPRARCIGTLDSSDDVLFVLKNNVATNGFIFVLTRLGPGWVGAGEIEVI